MAVDHAMLQPLRGGWQDYLELTKPRVVVLMLFTALVGMLLAVEREIPWAQMLFGLVGIALASMAGGAVNHIVDQEVDRVMTRTAKRPLPLGHVSRGGAMLFALVLAASAMLLLVVFVNALSAILTFLALIGYALIYTLLLKRTTPQNIVWGGAAGASPPLLGAAAVTGQITFDALLLVLIIFVWTPPHFWPLAIARQEDYRNVGIPMLPLTHGVAFTKAQVLYYSVMLLTVSMLPFATHAAGMLYLAGAILLGIGFIHRAWRLYACPDTTNAMATFTYSIFYLFLLFAFMLADRFLAVVGPLEHGARIY